jgi:DNA-binding response OmpR family regulator
VRPRNNKDTQKEAVSSRSSHPAKDAPTRSTRAKKKEAIMRIAVIENDQGLQQMIALLLGEEGFEVVSWLSGEGAYAMIVRERPDVVLLDLRLEESRTGLAILGEIRADPRTRDTAVILCSGDVQFLREHAAMLRAWRCGLIEKPFAIAALLAMIREFATPPRAADRIVRT